MAKIKAPDIDVIMVPVDMGEQEKSAKALAMAAQFAKDYGAKLYVMTAVHPLGEGITEYPEHHKPEFEAFIKEAGDAYGIEVEALFRQHESAEKMILEAAEEIKADLVVMATHDPKITDHLFGSHASHVTLHATCSVMVVR